MIFSDIIKNTINFYYFILLHVFMPNCSIFSANRSSAQRFFSVTGPIMQTNAWRLLYSTAEHSSPTLPGRSAPNF